MLKQKKQTIGFYIIWAAVGLVALMIFWRFWELLALAIILDIIFYPLYHWVHQHTKMPNFSAGLVVLTVALIIAGPLLLIGQQIFFELSDLYRSLHVGNWGPFSAGSLQ